MVLFAPVSLVTLKLVAFSNVIVLLDPVKAAVAVRASTWMSLLEPFTVMSATEPPSIALLEPLTMTFVTPAGIVRYWLDSSKVMGAEVSVAPADGAAGAGVAEESAEPAGAEEAGAEAAGAAGDEEDSAGAALFWVQPVRARAATATAAAAGRRDLMDMVSPFRWIEVKPWSGY